MRCLCKVRLNGSVTRTAVYEYDVQLPDGFYEIKKENEKSIITNGSDIKCELKFIDSYKFVEDYAGVVRLLNDMV